MHTSQYKKKQIETIFLKQMELNTHAPNSISRNFLGILKLS